MFWAITPLQSAIFVSKPRAENLSLSVQTFSPLLSPAEQVNTLDNSFIDTAFGVAYLSEDLPAFVTREFAIEPFDLGNVAKNEFTTWKVNSTAYSTDLDCTPAAVTRYMNEFKELVYTFHDELGCSVNDTDSLLNLNGGIYALRYFGFENDLGSAYALTAPHCTYRPQPVALTFWGEIRNQTTETSSPEFFNISASFCRANYFSQSVVATIASSNSSVLNVTPTGSRTALSDAEFNPQTLNQLSALDRYNQRYPKISQTNLSLTYSLTSKAISMTW